VNLAASARRMAVENALVPGVFSSLKHEADTFK